ncbi:putative 15-hydroxyprostaglandin dehydrogenase [Cadophora sp. MPI-SDFR-AT-0126]|nr:putative 15-hydroxyprostaglandin dehydrogenase [Leotiomycetes sp. MPI-SDFR-AT-0126]
MAHIQINEAHFGTLKDKVVVLTGGANGIGRAAVRLFHHHGANIVFGDINSQLGTALEAELSSHPSSPTAKFIQTDVTSYPSQLHLFKTAISLFGKIDIVVANAGISIPRDPFSFSPLNSSNNDDDEAEIENEFPTAEIDVNLKGCLFTARIGMFYLRKNRLGGGEGGGGDLVLVSSIAGFKESTGLAVYTASKHGVLGLLRGVRVQAAREGVRVNAVCPWMTKTAMVAGIESGWRDLHLPENEPEDVAKSILICATANRLLSISNLSNPNHPNPQHQNAASSTSKTDENEPAPKVTGHEGAALPFTGKILFVAGGQSYEIEDKMDELEPVWLGRENSEVLVKGQEFLMRDGVSWDTSKAK